MLKESKKRQPYYNYARYTGLAFQMMAIILVAVYAGIKLDKAISSKIPWFTILLSTTGVALAVYFAIKDLIRK